MKTVTGFGYLKNAQNQITFKYAFPVGMDPDPSSLYTQVEVVNQAALDAIQVYTVPLTPAQAFNVDLFCEALFSTFAADSNLFPYYGVLKDLAVFQNFAGMNRIVTALLAANVLTQDEVNSLNTVLAAQNIVLSTFTS